MAHTPFLECGLWFALQVGPQMENRVAFALAGKGYESFLPTYEKRRRWSDRIKVIAEPLFPGYVFCRISETCSGLVVATPGVRRIVSFGGKPYPVEEDEIEAVRRIVASRMNVAPWPYQKLGQKVRINEGPLTGVTGTIIGNKKKTAPNSFG